MSFYFLLLLLRLNFLWLKAHFQNLTSSVSGEYTFPSSSVLKFEYVDQQQESGNLKTLPEIDQTMTHCILKWQVSCAQNQNLKVKNLIHH